jgi:hypothetical protein
MPVKVWFFIAASAPSVWRCAAADFFLSAAAVSVKSSSDRSLAGAFSS